MKVTQKPNQTKRNEWILQTRLPPPRAPGQKCRAPARGMGSGGTPGMAEDRDAVRGRGGGASEHSPDWMAQCNQSPDCGGQNYSLQVGDGRPFSKECSWPKREDLTILPEAYSFQTSPSGSELPVNTFFLSPGQQAVVLPSGPPIGPLLWSHRGWPGVPGLCTQELTSSLARSLPASSTRPPTVGRQQL